MDDSVVETLQAMMRHRGQPPLIWNSREHEEDVEEDVWRNDTVVVRCVGDMEGAARRPEVEEFVDDLDENEHGIMVVGEGGLTTQAAQYVRSELEGRVEVFVVTELKFDIMTHYLMPMYEVVDKLPSQAASVDSLPVMLTSDPVARYLGLQAGAIVKAVRPNASSGTDITYRRVVN
jgi:DNA-directed RNA polymerase subunit H (RpoH/RPB5)